MKRETLHSEISIAVKSLLEVARESCFNEISDNCCFIMSKITDSDHTVVRRKIRNADNAKRTPTSLDSAVTALDKLYPDLYDVNLYVYKADAGLSVIEIRYYLRSSLGAEFQGQSTSTETMLHVKVPIPPYASWPREKFDIHWAFWTLNHRWKMFWWRWKVRCMSWFRFLNNLKS